MPNWFKVFESDLNNPRLQWAMTEQQQCAIVYFALLSRCCQEKSEKIRWPDADMELIGLAHSVQISVPIANQALGLLQRIQFVEIKGGFLKVLAWKDHQSEYLSRKGYFSKRYEKAPLSTVKHSEALLEEIRSDQKILDQREDFSAADRLSPRLPKTTNGTPTEEP